MTLNRIHFIPGGALVLLTACATAPEPVQVGPINQVEALKESHKPGYAFNVELSQDVVFSSIAPPNAKICQLQAATNPSEPRMLNACNRSLMEDELTDQNRAITYYNRGLIYSNMRQFDLAETDYRDALEIKPDLAESYLGLATIEYQRLNYEGVTPLAQKALDIGTEQEENAYFWMGVAQMGLFEYDAAEAALQQAVSIRPSFIEARNALRRVANLKKKNTA